MNALRIKSWRKAAGWLGVLLAAALAGFWGAQRRARPAPSVRSAQWDFGSADRILVLAPHPDDEVLGCAGAIQAARRQNLPVKIVYFTYGDNNEWAFLLYSRHPVLAPAAMRAMGEIRHAEAMAAGRALGVAATNLVFLGYPDYGTLQIWNRHWGAEPPHRSMLTRVAAVPYADAFRPGAPYKGEEILADLETIFRDFRPTHVFVSHPADHHLDHRSLYLFARVALWELAGEIRPALHPYLIHFKGWPRPLAYRPDDVLAPTGFFGDELAWHSYGLAPAEVETKRRALDAHASEVRAAPGLLAFVRRNELFGDFPPIRLPSVPAPAETESFEPAAEELAFLTPDERAHFVGIEERMIGREKDQLVIRVRLSRPLARAVELTVQAFGYRADKPFRDMPKIRVELGELHVRVLDQSRVLPEVGISVERKGRDVSVRIPLAVLGDPQRILTSVHAYLGDVPLDWVAWREIDLDE